MSGPGPSQPAGAARKDPAEKRRNTRELARSGAMLVLAGLLVAFALLNLNEVSVDWVFGSGHAPLIIVIVVSLVIGVVLTHFSDRFARWRRR